MIKSQVLFHQAQIEKAKEIFKDKLSPQALMIISNMQHIIDKLIEENNTLEQILREDNINQI